MSFASEAARAAHRPLRSWAGPAWEKGESFARNPAWRAEATAHIREAKAAQRAAEKEARQIVRATLAEQRAEVKVARSEKREAKFSVALAAVNAAREGAERAMREAESVKLACRIIRGMSAANADDAAEWLNGGFPDGWPSTVESLFDARVKAVAGVGRAREVVATGA
jgi:hypothetical protein